MNPEDTGLELLKAGAEGAARETVKQSFGALENFSPFVAQRNLQLKLTKKKFKTATSPQKSN